MRFTQSMWAQAWHSDTRQGSQPWRSNPHLQPHTHTALWNLFLIQPEPWPKSILG